MEEAKRDYKAEYKKFQSSTKAKKYRAELNKYNRKKGTYGNGDGKDASHKGGKIVGFEAQSKNRGRAEKSRLKKESNVVEGKLESLALNLLRNINREAGVKKYDHTKTADFNKVMKFLRNKMPKTPDRKLGDIAMSYNDYRKKQPKATIPDIDSVKDMEKTLKKLGMKEGVYEKNKGKTLYGKDLVNYFVKRFKYSTRDATAVANKLKDVGFKVPKVLPKYESVNEGVDILNELRIDLPNFDKEKHKRDIFGLFNKLKIKGMLGDRRGKANWLILKDKDDWKKAEPILKKLKIKYKLKESAEGEHHQAITKFILTALSKAGIKIKRVQMMKKSWLQGKYWYGGFFTVRAQSGNDVLPFYVDKKGNVNLQVSPKDYIIGKYPNMSTLVQNLKDFKKTDLDESVNESAWTPAQEKAVKELDKKFNKVIGKKGIEPYSVEASRMWTSGGFRDEMKKIFGKNESVNKSKLNELDWNQDLMKMSSEIDRLFKMAKIKVLKHIPYKKGYRTGDAALYGAFIHVKDKDGEKTVLPIEIDKKGIIRYAGGPNNWHPLEKIGALNMSHAKPDDTLKIKTYARSIDYLKQFAKLPGFGQDVLFKKEGINEREMSIKDAFKDLVKDHGSKKALDILTSVLTGGIGFEDPKKKKQFQQKLLKKMTKESANEIIEGLGDKMSKISKKYAKGQNKSKKALKNKKGPYQEGMNENSAEKAKIVKLLIKYGNNPKEVKPWVNKHYKKAKGDRSGATPAQLAQYISFLTANESVNEAKNTNVEWNNFEKAFGDFFTTVIRLGKANTKLTGDKTDEKIFIKNFNKDVGNFYSLMQSWVRGQNESIKESVNEKKGDFLDSLFPKSKVAKAIKIAHDMGGDMTGAVKKIEKYFKGMSLHTKVQDALRQANESINEEKYVVYVDKDGKGRKGRKIVKSDLTYNSAKRLSNKLAKTDDYQEVGFDDHKSWNQNNIEKLNEAQNKIADIRNILKTKKGKRIDSIFMDVETAEKVIKHYKSLKGSAKEKFVKQKIQNIVKSVKKESVNEAKYKGYDWKRQNRKDGHPLIVPALQKTFANMKDLKKYIDKHGTMESINEMTKRQAAETLKQLGGNKFIVMTGAKRFAFSDKGLGFKIGRNAKAVNYVHISLNGKDLYDMKFQKGTRVLKKVDDVYGDQLQKMFTKYTGMYTSLGTMGR